MSRRNCYFCNDEVNAYYAISQPGLFGKSFIDVCTDCYPRELCIKVTSKLDGKCVYCNNKIEYMDSFHLSFHAPQSAYSCGMICLRCSKEQFFVLTITL